MSQAEVGGVVSKEHAELSRAIFWDPATDDDTAQGDGLAITTLQTEQARTVAAGISTRQVTYLQPAPKPPRRWRRKDCHPRQSAPHRRGGAPAHQASADPPGATDSPVRTTRRQHPDHHCRPGAQPQCHHALRRIFHPSGTCRCGLLIPVPLRRRRSFRGRLRGMAGLLVPWPVPGVR